MFSTAATGITHKHFILLCLHHQHHHVCVYVYTRNKHAKTRLNNYYGYINTKVSLVFSAAVVFLFQVSSTVRTDVCVGYVIDWSIKLQSFCLSFALHTRFVHIDPCNNNKMNIIDWVRALCCTLTLYLLFKCCLNHHPRVEQIEGMT